MPSRRRLTKAALALGLSVVTVPAFQPAAHAVRPADSLADLESAVLGHSCPTPETTAFLSMSPTDANSAAAILGAAREADSPLLPALFDMYWAARDGSSVSADYYSLTEFAACFANGLDVSRYEEQLQRAMQSIDSIDEQVQALVDHGSATIDDTVHTATELAEPVVALAMERIGESSQLALALLLELVSKSSMLQYASLPAPGADAEAAARPEVNDVQVAALDVVDPVIDSVPSLVEWPVRRCKFRQTQSGDQDGGTGTMTFVMNNGAPLGFKRDLYELVTHESTYIFNVDLKCMKFADMPSGDFDFNDLTPFPDNVVCSWNVLEPYGYHKFYEFLPGFPQSGYMMRNIYDVGYECDTLYIPFFDLQVDRDCPFNNVYAHYDDDFSWYFGEPTSVCH